MRRRPLPPHRRIMIALFWVLLILMCAFIADELLENQMFPNRHQSTTLLPGEVRELRLRPNIYHNYTAWGSINGHKAQFLLDTGASYVSVPEKLAQKWGLKKQGKSRAITANGIIEVYNTRIDTLEFGGITLHNIKASINPHMSDKKVLLGMSALKHVEFTQTQGELIIHQEH